ncbi:hypothetical protein QYE76_032445 [Lolium multiflorum]|uniref:Uncharacterized protein n=1 Tax=Lolium multiflorum TaxID=4521 RepID=A0AAD8QVS6_LOLMU|nr:hypothetical protein QYE76_032445 [Lolium multiflorum]
MIKKGRPPNRKQKIITSRVNLAIQAPPPTPEYLDWSDQYIGFGMEDHPYKFLDQVTHPWYSMLGSPDYEDEVTVNVKGKGVEGSSGPKQKRVTIRKKSNATTNPGSSAPRRRKNNFRARVQRLTSFV